MGQTVERGDSQRWTFEVALYAHVLCLSGRSPDPDDVETLTYLHQSVLYPLNGSPALVRAGDRKVSALARIRCGRCSADVGTVNAYDATARGGPVIFWLSTQNRPASAPTDPARTVSVVLGADGDLERGRLPIPVPSTVLAWCRAHGTLAVKVPAALDAG